MGVVKDLKKGYALVAVKHVNVAQCTGCVFNSSLKEDSGLGDVFCNKCGSYIFKLVPEFVPLCPKCPDLQDCPHSDNRTICWEYYKAIEKNKVDHTD